MRIGSALSTDPDPGKATAAAADEAGSQLGGPRSRWPWSSAPGIMLLPPKLFPRPAVAVWLASLPEPVETFHMEFVRTSEGGATNAATSAIVTAPSPSTSMPGMKA